MREVNISPIRVIDRMRKVLDCFTFENPTLTIDEIVRQTALPKSTIYRMLWTMEKNGFVQFDTRNNEYRLGYKFLEYGGIVLDNIDVRKESEEILTELHNKTGYNVLLAIRRHEYLQYLVTIESKEEFKSSSTVGKSRALHYGVLGNVLMAYMPIEEVQYILKKYPLEKLTPYTIVDENVFIERLSQIRSQGYFVDVNETFVGFTAIGMPIFGINDEVVAAIGVAGASFKLEGEHRQEIIKLMKHASNRISINLGKHSKF